jgi:hypothetical protein
MEMSRRNILRKHEHINGSIEKEAQPMEIERAHEYDFAGHVK